jgi:hypothetical protein
MTEVISLVALPSSSSFIFFPALPSIASAGCLKTFSLGTPTTSISFSPFV